jgi:hypothetical protein
MVELSRPKGRAANGVRLPRWLIVGWAVLGVVLTVLSFPSIPGEVAGWGPVLAAVDEEPWRWLLPAIGWLGLVGLVAYLLIERQQQPERMGLSNPQPLRSGRFGRPDQLRLAVVDVSVDQYAFPLAGGKLAVNQVAAFSLHNARQSGGRAATIWGVLPEVEISDTEGTRVFRYKGWDVPRKLNFTPSQEEQRLAVAEKLRYDAECYGVRGKPGDGVYSGDDELKDPDGTFEVRVTFRGDGLEPPQVEYFTLRNRGIHGLLFEKGDPRAAETGEAEERVFVPSTVTLAYLVGLFDKHTTTQANRLASPFIGKWMRVTGPFRDLSELAAIGRLNVTMGTNAEWDLAHYCFLPEWRDRLEALVPGTEIRIAGRIVRIGQASLFLEDCELVGEGEG